MCLALLSLDAHPSYALVVAANRDEYHARPTAPAHWWDEGLLAGRDLHAGGTWLGVTREGRFALLTNFRDPARNDANAPSRGSLVPQVLLDPDHADRALMRIVGEGARYNGFNLVAGTHAGATWGSNRAAKTQGLGRGTYGLSNALLDEPWPKVVSTKAALEAWVASGDADVEPLFEALARRTIAADADLPATGIDIEWERRLSAPFIVSETYGTRCSTVFTIDRRGYARFIERSFDADGEVDDEVELRFDRA
jgi:uncharacterized protein with NRDE domain